MMATELKFNRLTLAILITLGVVVVLFVLSNIGKGQSYTSESIRLSELISASVDLARKGGKRVVEIRHMDDSEIGKLSKGQTKEGKNEYVTIGDQESHQLIISGLKSLWPNLPVQSEEKDLPLIGVPSVSRYDTEVMAVINRDEVVEMDKITVWVDPLDATQEYTEGAEDPSLLKFVTVMICVAVNGKPVAGIIHEPFTGVTNWGWVEHGISKSLQSSRKMDRSEKDLFVTYSRSHAGDVSRIANAAFGKEYVLKELVAAGSGYKVLQVVKGEADLYLHTTRIKKWDICAGNAVLNAVGGRMTTMKGKEIDYGFGGSAQNEDGIVAAKPVGVQQTFVELLRSNKS